MVREPKSHVMNPSMGEQGLDVLGTCPSSIANTWRQVLDTWHPPCIRCHVSNVKLGVTVIQYSLVRNYADPPVANAA